MHFGYPCCYDIVLFNLNQSRRVEFGSWPSKDLVSVKMDDCGPLEWMALGHSNGPVCCLQRSVPVRVMFVTSKRLRQMTGSELKHGSICSVFKSVVQRPLKLRLTKWPEVDWNMVCSVFRSTGSIWSVPQNQSIVFPAMFGVRALHDWTAARKPGAPAVSVENRNHLLDSDGFLYNTNISVVFFKIRH